MLVLIVVVSVCAQVNDQLPPPKPTLVAVHFPDLSQLESDVKNQITSQQNSLAAAIKDPDAKLSAHVNLGATLTQLGDLKGAAEEFE